MMRILLVWLLFNASFAFFTAPRVFPRVRHVCSDEKEVLRNGDVVDALSSITKVSKKDVAAVLENLSELLYKNVLVTGNEVRLKDVGTFKIKNLAARTGRNPKTGEPLQIAASKSVTFVAASKLKSKDEK